MKLDVFVFVVFVVFVVFSIIFIMIIVASRRAIIISVFVVFDLQIIIIGWAMIPISTFSIRTMIVFFVLLRDSVIIVFDL